MRESSANDRSKQFLRSKERRDVCILQPSPHPLAAISLGQIGARRASCFIPSRDPGRGEDLCSPGCETCSWRRAFVVQRSWRTCRLGGKNDRSTTPKFYWKRGIFSSARN